MPDDLTTQRRPRYRRVNATELPLKLQPQDQELLKWVYRCRFLTSRHLQALDPRHDQFVLRRLQRLFHHGYLSRIRTLTKHNDVFIYALGDRGAEELRLHGVDVPKVGWDKKNAEVKDQYFVAHELMIGDFRVTLHRALKDRRALTLSSASPGDVLQYVDDAGKQRKIEPDWPFTLLDGDDELDFFLEADRSTMTDGDYLAKLRAYWLFWKQEKQKADQGLEARDAFRVLTVCKTEARARNLRATARYADDHKAGSGMFWFTSAERYSIQESSHLFDPIWQTPKGEGFHHLLE